MQSYGDESQVLECAFPANAHSFSAAERAMAAGDKGGCQQFKSLALHLLTFIIQYDFKQEYPIFMGNWIFLNFVRQTEESLYTPLSVISKRISEHFLPCQGRNKRYLKTVMSMPPLSITWSISLLQLIFT